MTEITWLKTEHKDLDSKHLIIQGLPVYLSEQMAFTVRNRCKLALNLSQKMHMQMASRGAIKIIKVKFLDCVFVA